MECVRGKDGVAELGEAGGRVVTERDALGLSDGKDGLHPPCFCSPKRPCPRPGGLHRDTTELMEL